MKNLSVGFVLLMMLNHCIADSSDTVSQIDNILLHARKHLDFNGTLLIARSDQLLYHKAIGYTQSNKQVKLSTQHRFSSGAIGNEFTTAAIMILKDKRDIAYSESLSTHLPSLPDWASTITIRHLLTHTSGLPKIDWKQGISTEDVLHQLNNLQGLVFKPGESYLYSNLNVFLRALVIEKISHMPFEIFSQKVLFSPSGMSRSFVETDNPSQQGDTVSGDYPSSISGVSIYTTALDLYRWEQALWRGHLIKKNALQNALTPHQLAGSINRTLFDFGNVTRVGEHIIESWHDGSNTNHHIIKYNNFNQKLIVVIMSNDGSLSTLLNIKRKILQLIS